MKQLELHSETDSKNYFEKYLQLIERYRLEKVSQSYLNELQALENGIISFEALLKEKSELINSHNIVKYLNEKGDEFIKNWYVIFEKSSQPSEFLTGFNYRLFVSLNALQIINAENFFTTIKYLIRLNPEGDYEKSDDIGYITQLGRSVASGTTMIVSEADDLGNLYQIKSEARSYFDYQRENINILNRDLKNNFFLFDFRQFYGMEIGAILQRVRDFDLTDRFERLFILEGSEHFLWSINIKWENKSGYKANSISYLIWALSSALESIDDVSVELVDWGKGSMWADLSVKIKSNVSKIDALFLLKKIRQLTQAAATNQSLEDILKKEAETNKIKTETKILETDFKRKEEIADIKTQMDLYERALDIQKKEGDIEKQKLELAEKKLSLIERASEMVKSGLIQQDGELHVSINDCLFVANYNGHLMTDTIDNIPEIEAKGKKEIEDDDDSITSVEA